MYFFGHIFFKANLSERKSEHYDFFLRDFIKKKTLFETKKHCE